MVREGGRLKEREREGEMKQMCQNCIPTLTMNSLRIGLKKPENFFKMGIGGTVRENDTNVTRIII